MVQVCCGDFFGMRAFCGLGGMGVMGRVLQIAGIEDGWPFSGSPGIDSRNFR